MKDKLSFVSELETNYAFLAKSVFDLHNLIQLQSEELYLEKEMGFPVAVSSTLLFFSKVNIASTTQIAKALNITHQLVSQRIKILLKLELIAGFTDPDDKRKTLYRLTTEGQDRVKILNTYCFDASNAFKELSEEVGVDLQKVLNQTMEALKNKPFGKRFPNQGKTYAELLSDS